MLKEELFLQSDKQHLQIDRKLLTVIVLASMFNVFTIQAF